MNRLFIKVLPLLFIGLAGCGSPPQETAVDRGAAPRPASRPASRPMSRPAPAGDSRERQAQFLREIRSADPQFKTIEKAAFNERGELGLVLDRDVPLDSIKPMLKVVLTRMDKAFPGRDATVIAYAPNGMEIGTAYLDARSRKMWYKGRAG